MHGWSGVGIAIVAWLAAAAGIIAGGLLLGPAADPLFLVLAAQAAALLPVLVLLPVLGARALGLGPCRPLAVLAGAAWGVVALGVSLAGFGLTVLLIGQPPESERAVERVLHGLHADLGAIGLLAIAALLPGVVEELLFRGVILRGLRCRLSPSAAVIITALLFAALHLSPWRFLPQLLMGCLMGWLALRHGSVWPAVAAHAVHNGLVLAAMLGAEALGVRPDA
ncbi:MAG: hypothetical protein RL456_3256 [Pseudomonadota bacterium]|jgi:membrane protease YdiL (CAAX protease family)